MRKVFYYAKRFGYNALPSIFFRRNYKRFKHFEQECDELELSSRINYYCKVNHSFDLPAEAVSVKNFRRRGGTDYYLDLKDFLQYFSPHTRFAYHFGDVVCVSPFPALIKARPVDGQNANSILFKLNKKRHFKWVNDTYTFSEKKNLMVWRGSAYHKLRRDFVEKFWNHTLCNVGQTNKPNEDVPWQKGYLSIKEQLKYKFILSIEGNDVATNLKWIMSSNSLCFMPKPKYETWFMEGLLLPSVHYVEINSDYTDLQDKILYYSTHIKEAEEIIENAHQHVKRFKNSYFEDLLCLKILERYTDLSGQQNAIRFE